METRIVYVSRDHDNVVKFWKKRPVYNESEDEFHGDFAELTFDALDKAQLFAERHVTFGECCPLFISQKGFSGPSFSQRIKAKSRMDLDEVIPLLELGFRQVVFSLGKEDEKYEDETGLDISAFCSRIIRFGKERAYADEMITDVFACQDSEEGDEYYLVFMVHTESMSVTMDEYMDIREILRDNANHFFGLLELLEALEKNVVYVEEIEPSDEEIRVQILAGKVMNCNYCYYGNSGSEDVRALCSMLSSQFGVRISSPEALSLNMYLPFGTHIDGEVLGVHSGFSLPPVYRVIGRRESQFESVRWWVAVDEKSHELITESSSEIDAVRYVYASLTGNKDDVLEYYRGSDFYAEVVSESEKYDRENYGGQRIEPEDGDDD